MNYLLFEHVALGADAQKSTSLKRWRHQTGISVEAGRQFTGVCTLTDCELSLQTSVTRWLWQASGWTAAAPQDNGRCFAPVSWERTVAGSCCKLVKTNRAAEHSAGRLPNSHNYAHMLPLAHYWRPYETSTIPVSSIARPHLFAGCVRAAIKCPVSCVLPCGRGWRGWGAAIKSNDKAENAKRMRQIILVIRWASLLALMADFKIVASLR